MHATKIPDTFLQRGRANTKHLLTMTRMKLQFPNYLGDYRYSFQGSSELISITVRVSVFRGRVNREVQTVN